MSPWKAGCGGNRTSGFGGRAEETDRSKGQHRASVRSNHTRATLALAAGGHPKVVQERLGHANISITLDVYSHVTAPMRSEAAERVAGIIFDNA